MFSIYQPLPKTEAEIAGFLSKVRELIVSLPDREDPNRATRCFLCSKQKDLEFFGIGFIQDGAGVKLDIGWSVNREMPGWISVTTWREERPDGGRPFVRATTQHFCSDCTKKVVN